MGNSEVGHLNLGAGRVVHQDVTRISMSIRDGSFFALPGLADLAAKLGRTGGRLHLVGLCSDGGVHSEIGHLHALLDWAERARIPVRLHCITDGRDASPTSGAGWIGELASRTASSWDARIATVSGRWFAMDRDRRWPRVERAYRAIAAGADAACALRRADGGAVCWGFDGLGQVSGAPDRTFSAVSMSAWHACAVLVDGEAVCWGDDSAGQSRVPLGPVAPRG